MWGGKVRRRSIDNVIEEIALLKATYKIKSIDFVDGTFTYDRKYLETFCHRISESDLGVNWRCCARYDNLDEKIINLMKQSGCTGLFFGLESGSNRVLKSINKKTNVEQIQAVSDMVYQSGIPSITSIMFGVPNEDKNDVKATLALMRKIKTEFFEVNNYTPLPGSRLYDVVTDEDKHNIDWLEVSFKSFDNYFTKSISREDLKGCLSEAWEIANEVRNKTILRYQAAMAASKA
jgi:radical SAM superfamily enzyme YgiQ (UPF0313 family)